VGAHGALSPPRLLLAQIANRELAEILALEQLRRLLRHEDLCTFGGVAELRAARFRRADPTDPGLFGVEADADRRYQSERPIVGCDAPLGGNCGKRGLLRSRESR
jgi:hypothetical protein